MRCEGVAALFSAYRRQGYIADSNLHRYYVLRMEDQKRSGTGHEGVWQLVRGVASRNNLTLLRAGFSVMIGDSLSDSLSLHPIAGRAV
jgi:hypothetical protein